MGEINLNIGDIVAGLRDSAELYKKHKDEKAVLFRGMSINTYSNEWVNWLIEKELMKNLYAFLHREMKKCEKTGRLSLRRKLILVVPDIYVSEQRFFGVSSELICKGIMLKLEEVETRINAHNDAYPFDIHFHRALNKEGFSTVLVICSKKTKK